MTDVIEIEIELGNAEAVLRRAADALEDTSPLMAEIAQELEFSTQRRFETETDPDGRPWKPSQRALREGGKTLQLTRTLLRAVRSESGRDYAAVGVGREGGAGVYAAAHQFGAQIRTSRGTITLPARAYLGFSESNRAATREIVTDYLKKAFR